MPPRVLLACVCLAALPWTAPVAAQRAAAASVPEITVIQGDLYRLRDGQRDTVFLVTPEGIILADPLSFETATWLKAALAERLPQRQVRFVLHTHHHFDRAEGAVVFTQTAEVVAHRRFDAALSAARTSWPAFLGIADRNGNRVLDAAEVADSPRGALVRERDRDGDGRVRPEELYRRVQPPETTHDGRRTIALGGKTVEMIYTGTVHAPDMTALYFPAERVLFVADPPVEGTRLSLGGEPPRDVMRWLEAVGQLDFDRGVTGDGQEFSAETIRELRAYVADLVTGVAAGRAAGQSLEEVQAAPFLERHASKPFATDRARHIEAVYRTVRVLHVDMSAAAVVNYAPHPKGYCEGFTACGDSKPVTLGAIGFSVSGVRLGLSAEFTAGDQSWHVLTSPFFDEEFAARATRGAVLFRYRSARRGFVSGLVGGISVTKTNIKGMTRQKEAFARAGGLRPFETDQSSVGITGGVDLARRLAGRIDLIVPIRVTRLMGGDGYAVLPLRTDIQVGVGVTYGLDRRVN
jgi:glyoxylase-like metal-dependent hydrolase (beta-lactamase superfamily II)